MNRTKLVARCTAAAATTTVIAGMAAFPAGARPDQGDPISPRFSSYDNNRPLTRIGTQLTRGDDLTGGGVKAPLWVPELFPQSPQGDG